MEQAGSLKISKRLYENYFKKISSLVKPKKKIFVNFDLSNFFLATSLPYFKKVNIFYEPKSNILIKADNDNDRIYVYYQKKEILPDVIFYNVALDKKYQNLGVPIFFSQKLKRDLELRGKKIFLIKTGHFYFKQAYKKFNLDLAFEPSGHFYCFRDLKTEAPYLMMSIFLHRVDLEKLPLLKIQRLSLKIKKNIDLDKIVNKLKKYFGCKLKKFDGFFLSWADNYLHLRKSKTENKLRISFEGEKKIFQEIKKKWLMKL